MCIRDRSVSDPNLLTANLNSLTLTSGGTTPFLIGPSGGGTTAPANGTLTGLSAGSISVTDVKGITANSAVTASSTSNAVTFDTASLVNNTTISGGAG